MKKYFGIIAASLLVGCLGTNRKINIARTDDGVSAVTTKLWWQTPYTANTEKDKNPWLDFVPDRAPSFEDELGYFNSNVIRWPEKMPQAAETGEDRTRKNIELQQLLEKLRKLAEEKESSSSSKEVF